MYVNPNFKTKKELKEAVARGDRVEAFQPGPFGPKVVDGKCTAEGPHSPEPHKWYAVVIVKNGLVIKVLQ